LEGANGAAREEGATELQNAPGRTTLSRLTTMEF